MKQRLAGLRLIPSKHPRGDRELPRSSAGSVAVPIAPVGWRVGGGKKDFHADSKKKEKKTERYERYVFLR